MEIVRIDISEVGPSEDMTSLHLEHWNTGNKRSLQLLELYAKLILQQAKCTRPYTFVKVIANGLHGVVLEVVISSDSKSYAVKIQTIRSQEEFENEIQVMTRFIELGFSVGLLQHCKVELLHNGHVYTYGLMIMEKLTSTLNDLLNWEKTVAPKLMDDYYDALQNMFTVMRANNIGHHDMHSNNIGMIDGKVKLIDFGLGSTEICYEDMNEFSFLKDIFQYTTPNAKYLQAKFAGVQIFNRKNVQKDYHKQYMEQFHEYEVWRDAYFAEQKEKVQASLVQSQVQSQISDVPKIHNPSVLNQVFDVPDAAPQVQSVENQISSTQVFNVSSVAPELHDGSARGIKSPSSQNQVSDVNQISSTQNKVTYGIELNIIYVVSLCVSLAMVLR
jgi:tRNA A-37 threonylcarbamoyl transferase component Bud32